jgi:CRISPR/Cas system-associated endonuclease Cas1
MKEYGRHVQKIVENCMQEKNREKRNQFAKEIIELMGQLNPHLRNVEDFRHKLWDHLFIMSGYKLDVDSPYPIKKREEIERKPEKLPYPQSRIKHKHYGKNVEALVAKARDTEDPEKKAEFTKCIGNFMKLVYQNWSKDDVNDETIKNDLRLLSKGELQITEDQDINALARANKSKQRPEDNQRKGGGGKHRHGHGGGRNKNFKKRR